MASLQSQIWGTSVSSVVGSPQYYRDFFKIAQADQVVTAARIHDTFGYIATVK